MSTIQYSQALYCLIMEEVIAYPDLVLIYALKDNVSNGFYFITMRPGYAPKLGLVPPSYGNGEDLVKITLNLPMGWKNYPLIL